MKRLIASTSLSLALAAFGIAQTQAGGLSANLSLPTQVNLMINETGCENSPGPWVTVEGVIAFGDVCTKVIFKNNAKGTHTAEVVRETEVVLSLGEPITLPKQPSRGGVGG